MATFCSHPNADLLQEVGTSNSFVEQLKRLGFRTTFIKGDSRHYSPEEHLLKRLGFDQVIAREDFYSEPQLRKYMRGTGVADKFVYDKLIDLLAEDDNERTFYTLLGVDTHPGKREVYPDLEYPDVAKLIPPNIKGEVLRDIAWHDHDIGSLWKALQHSPAFNDDFVLILTADHCRPLAGELLAFPGYPKDSMCRIPFVLLTPRALPSASRRMGSQVDLAPTVMHLVNGPVLAGWWGRSLLDPTADNPAVSVAERTLLLRTDAGGQRRVSLDRPQSPQDADLAALVDTIYLRPESANISKSEP